MATALITLTDNPDGDVNVVIAFGEDGAQSDSAAHQMAATMVRTLVGGLEDEEDN